MKKNGKNAVLILTIIVFVFATLTLSFAVKHEFTGNAAKAGKQATGPFVIFKFDDLSDTGVPWSGFKAVTDICKAKGVKCTLGIFGQTLLTRNSAQSINLSWNSSEDSESQLDGYIIYRNGVFINIIPRTTYTDKAGINLPDTTIYQICAVNRANLFSAKSRNVSIAGRHTFK